MRPNSLPRYGPGKKPEGDIMLRPPMPWPIYRSMTDDDLKAIYRILEDVDACKDTINPRA